MQCPRCGYAASTPPSVVLRNEIITEGVNPVIESKGIFGTRPNAANEWIDIPCPKCRSTYQYNTRTQDVRL